MATESSITINANSPATPPVDTILLAGGDHQQIMRDAAVNAAPPAPSAWTVTTAGVSNQVAADMMRVSVLITSNATGRVWMRFDATIPTATSYSAYIDPDQIMTIGPQWATRAISVAGESPGGTVFFTLGNTT